MIRSLLFILYGIVMISLQSIFRIPGDFLLLAVIFFGFYEETFFGLVFALLFGFLMDTSSIAPMGTSLFSYTFLFGFIRIFRTSILFKTFFSRLVWVALLSLIYSLLSCAAMEFLTAQDISFLSLMMMSVLSVLTNSLLSIVWIPFLLWYRNLTVDQLFKPEDSLLKR